MRERSSLEDRTFLRPRPGRGFASSLLGLALLALTQPGALAGPAPVPERPRGAVHDGASVMRPADVQAIELLSRILWEKARVAVVAATVPDLGGETIEEFSIRTAKAWGIGGAEEDRGVLILVSIGDQRARIETGYGVEGYLPDGLTGEILDTVMIPLFRRGDISGGLRAAVERIAVLTAEEFGFSLEGSGVSRTAASERRGGSTLGSLTRLIFGGIMLLVLLAVGIRNPFLLLLLLGASRGRFHHGRGGFGGGGFGGGGFGGFGGGGFGGGGASRGW